MEQTDEDRKKKTRAREKKYRDHNFCSRTEHIFWNSGDISWPSIFGIFGILLQTHTPEKKKQNKKENRQEERNILDYSEYLTLSVSKIEFRRKVPSGRERSGVLSVGEPPTNPGSPRTLDRTLESTQRSSGPPQRQITILQPLHR